MKTYDTRKHFYLYIVNAGTPEFMDEICTCEYIKHAANVFKHITGTVKWTVSNGGLEATADKWYIRAC